MFAVSVLVFISLLGCTNANVDQTVAPETKANNFLEGHALNCIKNIGGDLQIFEVLPGIGWDNIQNTELSQVLDRKYSQCKLTEDRKYLIPDDVFVIPIKQSYVDIFAEWYDSMDQYKSIDSFSINLGLSVNVGFGGLGVGGSFSGGYQRAKMHMSQTTKHKYISRVQARYNRYRIISDPSAALHPSFRGRLLEIASHFYHNHHETAEYLCQLFVRDYGTHVLTRVDAGAILFKEDHIETNMTKVDDAKRKSWQLGAGLSFNGIFDGISVGVGLKFGISKTHMEESIKEYNSKTSYSVIKSMGGSYFGVNTSASDWKDSLDNELVATDRDGIPVFELVSSATLPEIPLDTVMKVEQGIKNAFNSYYKHNTYRGCMDPRDKTYDIKANVNDRRFCGEANNTNGYLGGVYQTCTMTLTAAGDICHDKGYIQKNPLTSDFSCPKGYQGIELFSNKISKSQSHSKCKHKHKKCKYWTTYSSGHYKAYWCAQNFSVVPEQKYKFGGMYSQFKVNGLTGGLSCKENFLSLRIGDDIYVCVSSDGQEPGVKFGGFFSCQTGNPLAHSFNINKTSAVQGNHWPKRCPTGYLQHTFSVVNNCELDYCSDAVSLRGRQELPILKRPPYIHRPTAPPENYTDMVLVVDGKWYKNVHAFNKMVEMDNLASKVAEYEKAQSTMDRALSDMAELYTDDYEEPGHSTTHKNTLSEVLSPAAVAIISSLATLLCVILATVGFIQCRKRRRAQNSPSLLDERRGEMETVCVEPQRDYGAADEHRT